MCCTAAVGGINESDVILAKASNALIIGFNVRANPQARELARRDGVEIRYYSIIYNVIDDVKASCRACSLPTLRERFLGNASIREVFNITKVGKVAGCMVTEGAVRRGAKVRLLRDNVVIHEGTLKTLKRFKDEVREVQRATNAAWPSRITGHPGRRSDRVLRGRGSRAGALMRPAVDEEASRMPAPPGRPLLDWPEAAP